MHVIYAECPCARALFAHLVACRRFPGAEEVILFIGADARKQKSAEGAGPASRFGLDAGPVSIMFDSAGGLRYAGGYYAQPSTIASLDERIYAQLAAGAKGEPLRVFSGNRSTLWASCTRDVEPMPELLV